MVAFFPGVVLSFENGSLLKQRAVFTFFMGDVRRQRQPQRLLDVRSRAF